MAWRADYNAAGAILDWLSGELTLPELLEELPWKESASTKLIGAYQQLLKGGELPEITPPPPAKPKIWKHAEFKDALQSLPFKGPDGKAPYYHVSWPGPEEGLPTPGVVLTYSYGMQSIRVQVMESGLEDDQLVMVMMPIAVVSGAGDRSQ